MKYNPNFEMIENDEFEYDEMKRINRLHEIRGYLEGLYEKEFFLDLETESVCLSDMVFISVDEDNETLLVSFSNECSPTEAALMTATLLRKYEIEIVENFVIENNKVYFGEEADYLYKKKMTTKLLTNLNDKEDSGLCKFVAW